MRFSRAWLLAALSVILIFAVVVPSAESHSKTRKRSGKATSSKSQAKKGDSVKKASSKAKKPSRQKARARRLSGGEILASLVPPPVESPEALAPFWQALDKLGANPGQPGSEARVVRILHFGDSHVAADLWTGELRTLLQSRFGDAGPGYVMPGKPWKCFRHSRAKSFGGKGWQRCGLRDDLCQGVVGLSRVSLREGPSPRRMEAAGVEGEFRVVEIQWAFGGDATGSTVRIDGCPLARTMLMPTDVGTEPPPSSAPPPEELPLENLAPEDIPPIAHSCDGTSLGDTGYTFFAETTKALLPPGAHRIEASATGDALLVGADLRSGNPGILVDTLGINGSEIGDMEGWAPGVRATLLRHAAPALVLVSFGTNDMGAKGFDEAAYSQNCLGILQRLREDVPEAAVLVTGPLDRGGRSKRSRALMQDRSEGISRVLRQAALQAGCAFWDARAAMGGEGSMPKWAAAGMAQRDQVHLTEVGYKYVARFLHDALMAAYDRAKAPQPTQAREAGE